MKQEPESLFFNMQPYDDEEFIHFMEAFGALAPPVMTRTQLVSVLATVLQNYCATEDEDELDSLMYTAVNMVIGNEAAVALDLAVGPEDGIN